MQGLGLGFFWHVPQTSLALTTPEGSLSFPKLPDVPTTHEAPSFYGPYNLRWGFRICFFLFFCFGWFWGLEEQDTISMPRRALNLCRSVLPNTRILIVRTPEKRTPLFVPFLFGSLGAKDTVVSRSAPNF